jgi:hypothetical protein
MVSIEAVQVLIGQDGQPKAVQVEMSLWRKILAALEDADDVALAHGILAELDAAGGPEAAGWTKLDDIAAIWEADEAA